MAVSVTAQDLITPLAPDWAETARENTRRANANDANLKAAVEDLQAKVPVQKVKQGSQTFTPDADGLVTLPSGVVLPAMTTAQRNAITSPVVGQQIYNTSTGRSETYTASGWQGPIQALTTAQRTALTPLEGELVVDLTEGRLYQYLGGIWAPVGAAVVDIFTGSGTWTNRTGARLVIAICIGGGGAGSCISNSGSGTGVYASGGGGGGYCRKELSAAGLPSTVPVGVGAGGSVGGVGATTAGGSTAPFQNGGSGGDSTFGGYVTATGGIGGTASATTPLVSKGGAGGGFTGPALGNTTGTAVTETNPESGGRAGDTVAYNSPHGGGGGGSASTTGAGSGGSGGTPCAMNSQGNGAAPSFQTSAVASTAANGTSRGTSGLAGDGGGGAGTSTGNANSATTQGGNGGFPGGGGGGALARNQNAGSQSGAAFGGQGGNGLVIVVTLF